MRPFPPDGYPNHRCPESEEVTHGGLPAVWDVEVCERAGALCLALLSSGASYHELQEAGAVEVHRNPVDLPRRIDGSRLSAPGRPPGIGGGAV